MATPPVVRGVFVYNDTFFAQIDDSKRHPRASVADLTSLLRPDTTSAAPKDQVGHWYQAQLLHYGLPQSKDKNTAKVRLLQAINAGTLAVPDHVAKLEKDMKKEFNAAAKKAKAVEKTSAAPSKRKKRTHEESTSNTKITLTVGGVTISVDQQTAASITSAVATASPATKKAKTTKQIDAEHTKKPKGDTTTSKSKKPTDNSTKSTVKDSKPDKPTSKTTKSKDETTKAKGSSTDKSSGAQDKSTKPKATTAPKDKATTTKSKADSNAQNTEVPARKKQTARRSGALAALPSTRPSGDGPQYAHTYTPEYWDEFNNFGPQVKPEPDSDFTSRDLNGTYVLFLRSHSPDNVPPINGNPRISLHHDMYANKLWGHFTIGAKTGVLRVDNFAHALGTHAIFHFGWRARDLTNGQLRFGRGCDGVLELGVHGLTRGTFYRLFDGLDVDFDVGAVTRDTQMDWPEWMDEWECFVVETYGQ